MNKKPNLVPGLENSFLGSFSGKNPRQNLDTDKVLLLNF